VTVAFGVPLVLLAGATAQRWWLLVAAVVVAITATTIAIDRIARRVTRTAADIAAAAHDLGEGATTLVPVRGPRELASAAYAFNTMSERIAEQRAAERELIADLSHRLRTPLTALRLEAERARASIADNRLQQAVEGMEREVDHLILAARRNAAAAPTPPPSDPEGCDAAAVVRDRMAFWAAVAEDQSRHYTMTGTGRRAPVQLPRAELAAAVDALLGNVFRYTPQGTAFEVAVSRKDGFVAVRVDDAGPGIDDPGRAMKRGSSDRGSTGLGLDIVRRAAVAGKGTVDIGRAVLGGASIVVLLADANPPPTTRPRLGWVGRLSREPDERPRRRRSQG
jgi:signal transduction histidine kinase